MVFPPAQSPAQPPKSKKKTRTKNPAPPVRTNSAGFPGERGSPRQTQARGCRVFFSNPRPKLAQVPISRRGDRKTRPLPSKAGKTRCQGIGRFFTSNSGPSRRTEPAGPRPDVAPINARPCGEQPMLSSPEPQAIQDYRISPVTAGDRQPRKPMPPLGSGQKRLRQSARCGIAAVKRTS